MLERASVVGKEFWRGAVSRAHARPTLRDDVALLPARADAEGLIEPEPVEPSPGEDGFRFRHILIRDAAYVGLPKAARAELHERYADGSTRRRQRATRAGRDRRLPPRAGVPLPRGARRSTTGGRAPRRDARAACSARPGAGRCARERHRGGARTCSSVPSPSLPAGRPASASSSSASWAQALLGDWDGRNERTRPHGRCSSMRLQWPTRIGAAHARLRARQHVGRFDDDVEAGRARRCERGDRRPRGSGRRARAGAGMATARAGSSGAQVRYGGGRARGPRSGAARPSRRTISGRRHAPSTRSAPASSTGRRRSREALERLRALCSGGRGRPRHWRRSS